MAAVPLPRCDKCDKEFEKLLQCGRCKNAFYCSRECQNNAWKRHKNICRKPEEEAGEATLQAWRVSQATKPAPKKPPESSNLPLQAEDVEEAESFQQVRQELLKETKDINARMVSVMQASKGDPMVFLSEVKELKEEYHRNLRDRLRGSSSFKVGAEDEFAAAIRLGEEFLADHMSPKFWGVIFPVLR